MGSWARAVGHVWYILYIRIQMLGHVHSHVVAKMEKEQSKRDHAEMEWEQSKHDHVEMEREQLKHGCATARKRKQRDTRE